MDHLSDVLAKYECDILAIPRLGLRRNLPRFLEAMSVTVALNIESKNVNFQGAYRLMARTDGFVGRHMPRPDEVPAVEIALNYVDALEWIHTDTLLGYLLMEGRCVVRGEVYALSALEGIVSGASAIPTPYGVLAQLSAIEKQAGQ